MKELIVVAGAPGTGKTTVSKILAEKLGTFIVDFGNLRQIHLDKTWSNQSSKEEDMSFGNLLFILRNYKKHGYKNVILNDLQDFRVQQIPVVLSDFTYVIFSLYVTDEEELKKRILADRDSGYKNVDAAIAWNRELTSRPTVRGEIKIDNSHSDPAKTAEEMIKFLRE